MQEEPREGVGRKKAQWAPAVPPGRARHCVEEFDVANEYNTRLLKPIRAPVNLEYVLIAAVLPSPRILTLALTCPK